eukprot:1154888-Pelagomonas_calceolata.AAC.1
MRIVEEEEEEEEEEEIWIVQNAVCKVKACQACAQKSSGVPLEFMEEGVCFTPSNNIVRSIIPGIGTLQPGDLNCDAPSLVFALEIGYQFLCYCALKA